MTILPFDLRVTLLPKRFCRTRYAAGSLALPRAVLTDVTLPHVSGANNCRRLNSTPC